jgi:hypothetical protein
MWQLTWILNLLPDWVFNLLLITGIVGVVASYILKRIPFVNQYNTPLRILAVLIIIGTVWIKGGRDVQHAWEEKLKEAEAKVAQAQAESNTANVALEKEHKKKQKVIREYAITVKEQIVEKEKIIDAECKIAPEAITILNQSAKNPLRNGTVSVEITDGGKK